MLYRVNMTTESVLNEKEKAYQGFGGSMLISRILSRELADNAHPLGEYNKLVLTPGLLSGKGVPNAGRLSLGTKSPLTERIKESNVGGPMGHKLGRLGIRGIILEGAPQEDTSYILYVASTGISLVAMPELKGLNIYSTVVKLQEIYGCHTAVGCIGTAGEHKMALACIGFTDMQGLPNRQAGHGGLGAVMGSKGIKAIVVDDHGSRQNIIAKQDIFRIGTQKLKKAILSYYSMDKSFTGQGCSPGCLIPCPGKSKKQIKHFFNTYLGVKDSADSVLLNQLCNDLGVDTFELSAAIGIAIEAGFVEFGNISSVINAVGELGKATFLGRILGAGVDVTCKVFGKTNSLKLRNKPELSQDPAITIIESTGLCKFAMPAVLASEEGLAGVADMLNACDGWNRTFNDYLNVQNKDLKTNDQR